MISFQSLSSYRARNDEARSSSRSLGIAAAGAWHDKTVLIERKPIKNDIKDKMQLVQPTLAWTRFSDVRVSMLRSGFGFGFSFELAATSRS